MSLAKWLYEKVKKKNAPYYYNYSMLAIIVKPVRKFLTNSIAPLCPFNFIRIAIYRMCGFKIGKHCFIGMHCYLDDMCYDMLIIGDNCTISYGVYFACHGRRQGHYPITIENGAYIGMRANIISKNGKDEFGIRIGKDAVVGACSLVNKNVPDGMTAVGIPCKILPSAI